MEKSGEKQLVLKSWKIVLKKRTDLGKVREKDNKSEKSSKIFKMADYKKVPVETFWEKKSSSAQNEVDKTYTLSNSFSTPFSNTFDVPGFHEEVLDDHLLRHAHR